MPCFNCCFHYGSWSEQAYWGFHIHVMSLWSALHVWNKSSAHILVFVSLYATFNVISLLGSSEWLEIVCKGWETRFIGHSTTDASTVRGITHDDDQSSTQRPGWSFLIVWIHAFIQKRHESLGGSREATPLATIATVGRTGPTHTSWFRH